MTICQLISRRNATGFAVLVFAAVSILFAAFSISAQSTSPDFPTSVTKNEINGTVRPRDLGDSRVTSHYYLLGGDQGDVFINVVTNNFSGDIDLFTVNGLEPLTRIVVYADLGRTETGRAIYLRKSERLLLRVQGRTPNDDFASYTIKFAGSFIALKESDADAAPQLPRVVAVDRGGGIVNSVGTIIEMPSKPATEATAATDPPKRELGKTAPKETAAKSSNNKPVENRPAIDKSKAATRNTETAKNTPPAENSKGVPTASKAVPKNTKTVPPKTKSVRVKTKSETETAKADPVKENAPVKPASPVAKPAAGNSAAKTPPVAPKTTPGTTRRTRTTTSAARRENPPSKQPDAESDPMANFQLIVLFKDGAKIERPMTEVLRFGVDKGILTIVHRNGTIGRYSMLTIAKVSVE